MVLQYYQSNNILYNNVLVTRAILQNEYFFFEYFILLKSDFKCRILLVFGYFYVAVLEYFFIDVLVLLLK